MGKITRMAWTGMLAATLATAGVSVPQANAHDGRAGLFLGFTSGLIIGDLLANEANRRHYPYAPAYYYGEGPSCYPGPLQWRWQQVCEPGAYGQLYCQNVKNYYRPEICN